MARNIAAKSQNPLRYDDRTIDFGRHAVQCRICNHPERASIEFDFLNWRNPWDIVKSYELRNISTVYRHAHATGLFGRRRLNLRFALERMVERVAEVPVTASSVIRAVRAIASINDAGQWTEPSSRVIISREDARESRRKSRATRESQPPQRIFEPVHLEDAPRTERPEPPPPQAHQIDKNSPHPLASWDNFKLALSPELAALGDRHRREAEACARAQEEALAASQVRKSPLANDHG
ncbi:MAG TPA: hypothetical protein VGU63_12695 [Candidatus Acidoferrales bacterium]|nr:hypothetical protein [Candidatus Acidoferrales bacterium]